MPDFGLKNPARYVWLLTLIRPSRSTFNCDVDRNLNMTIPKLNVDIVQATLRRVLTQQKNSCKLPSLGRYQISLYHVSLSLYAL